MDYLEHLVNRRRREIGNEPTEQDAVREVVRRREQMDTVFLDVLPTTNIGFLRALSRALGLPMRLHAADLFDAAQKCLVTYADEHGPHPILILDDVEGLPVEVLDLVRRLTAPPAFHVKRADGRVDLFSDEAIRRIFQASMGRPRGINQLALDALIQAAVEGREHIDGNAMSGLLATHPLYHAQLGVEK